MTARRDRIAVFLILGVGLVGTSPAHGAPAGDEYIPRIPKASGGEVVAGEGNGPGSTILQPALRGTHKDRNEDPGPSPGSGPGSGPPSGTASGERSSAVLGTLGDPLVLLILMGVIGLAIAMTLRGRRTATLGPPPNSDDDEESLRRSGSPSTPDGEIVDGGDEPQ
jgi:hypothetical protein